MSGFQHPSVSVSAGAGYRFPDGGRHIPLLAAYNRKNSFSGGFHARM